MSQLSMEIRIELRKLGASKLSYLIDRVLEKTGSSVKMTTKQLCTIAELKRDFVQDALDIDSLRSRLCLPKKTREAEENNLDLLRTFDLIEGIMYSYKVKTPHKVGHRQPTIFRLPSSKELDEAFRVRYPTYIQVRLDTYLRYKADITQFLTVISPGRHSYGEIAKAAGVSDSTVKRHEKIAETQVLRHYASVPMSQWSIDALPEDYNDYLKNDKKYKFRGAWLEYKGIKEPYAKTGFQKHLLRGGTKDTIVVRWNKRGDHFAREGLVIERPIDDAEKKKFAHINDAVHKGLITLEQFTQLYPGLFGKSSPSPIKANNVTMKG
jgi:hypothetical protein